MVKNKKFTGNNLKKANSQNAIKLIADIVIPHHDREDLLKNCLKRIPKNKFNIIIETGGTFAENCNRGAKKTLTDKIIFVNDDTEPSEDVLTKIANSKADIIGVSQIIPGFDDKIYGLGVKFTNCGSGTIRFFATNKERVFSLQVFCLESRNPNGMFLGDLMNHLEMVVKMLICFFVQLIKEWNLNILTILSCIYIVNQKEEIIMIIRTAIFWTASGISIRSTKKL
ncbi:MAG: hypothetical protein WCZ08_03370 [Parcubacteria group bacterium]